MDYSVQIHTTAVGEKYPVFVIAEIGINHNGDVELAKKLIIPIIETDLLYSQIPLFDEAFITASNKEVMPVVEIDDQIVGNGKVGRITKRLMSAYTLLR